MNNTSVSNGRTKARNAKTIILLLSRSKKKGEDARCEKNVYSFFFEDYLIEKMMAKVTIKRFI